MVRALLYKSLLLAFFTLPAMTSIAQDEVEKQITKSYPIDEDGTITIENKYGDIEINGWEEDFVDIKIDVIVKGKNTDRIETLLDRIQPDITARASFISIETEFTEEKRNFFSNLFRTVTAEFNRSNLDVNYVVNLPKKVKLEIINKFGDVLINDYEGRMDVELEHGDLRILGAIDDGRVELKFGEFNTSDDFTGRLIIKNGEVNIRKSDYLSLDGSGSEIKIKSINKLVLTSNKDEIEIDYVETLNGNTRFTDIEIEEAGEMLQLDLHYGSLSTNSFSNTNPTILLNGNSSSIIINVEGISFDLDATLIEGQMRLPKTVANLESNMLNEKEKRRQVTASYGNAEKGSMKIIGKKGDIFLKEND